MFCNFVRIKTFIMTRIKYEAPEVEVISITVRACVTASPADTQTTNVTVTDPFSNVEEEEL